MSPDLFFILGILNPRHNKKGLLLFSSWRLKMFPSGFRLKGLAPKGEREGGPSAYGRIPFRLPGEGMEIAFNSIIYNVKFLDGLPGLR